MTLRRGIIAASALLFFVEPALAQEGASGVCSLPAADSAVPTATLLLRGGVVLIGGYSAVTASQGGGGDGDYGTSGKRVQILGALGVMAVGVLFPELMGFILEQLGSSAADLGLGCAW